MTKVHVLSNHTYTPGVLEPRAYEPPKAVKEHETQFHDNPNYVTIFEIWYMPFTVITHMRSPV